VGLGAATDPDALCCWILISGEALRQPEVQIRYAAAISKFVARLQAIIETGCESGAFADVEPTEAATAIVAAIQGYFAFAATSLEIVPPGSALPSMLKMAEGLLGSSLPAAPELRLGHEEHADV
jgi:TetR/AcrR family transcriptional repressor of bet genes